MFHMTMVPIWPRVHGWDKHVREDEETLPEALRPPERNQHPWRIKEVKRVLIFLKKFFFVMQCCIPANTEERI